MAATVVFFLMLVLLFTFASPAQGQQSGTEFTVDVSKTTPWLRTLHQCAGSSHGSTTLRQDWREHLAYAQYQTGISRVRFHGMLDDDMSAFLNGQGNWFNVHSSIDYLLSIGMNIIFEISFMPEALASDPSATVFHYNGGISPPADWNAWYAFIVDMGQDLVAYYGEEVVSTMMFEVWNEPNCGFWSGDQAQYFQMYNTTVRALKSVCASCFRIGGPATCQLQWIPELIAFVRENDIPIDMITSHLYPTDPQVNQSSRTGFEDYVAEAAFNASQAGLALVMTEFNSGLGINVLDTPYSSAFLVHTALAVQEIPNLHTLSYWTFTDVAFEEGGMVSTPFHDGYGMLNVNKVPKPSFLALAAMNSLPPNVASVSGPGARTGGGTIGNVDLIVGYQADGPHVFVNAILTNYNYYQLPISNETVTVRFESIPCASFPSSASLELIDESHGFAMPIWEAAGSPTYPSAAVLKAMNDAATLTPIMIPLASTAGVPYVTVELAPYAVAHVQFDCQI